jgi:hypothetical protein
MSVILAAGGIAEELPFVQTLPGAQSQSSLD